MWEPTKATKFSVKRDKAQKLAKTVNDKINKLESEIRDANQHNDDTEDPEDRVDTTEAEATLKELKDKKKRYENLEVFYDAQRQQALLDEEVEECKNTLADTQQEEDHYFGEDM